MENRSEKLARSLRGHEPVFGAWTSLGHPSITEIFVRMGVDFVGIDLEHSTINGEQAQRIIAASHAGGVACLPRVASHDGESIRQLLDSGADGVIVPNVTTVEEVQQIVKWCKYPPIGERSFGVSRAQGYGFDFHGYSAAWNRCSLLVIQIESVLGVRNIDRLLEQDAVDGVMMGPYDLSGSLGVPGRLEDPRVLEACSKVVEACRRVGKACGTQVVEPTPDNVEACFEQGYRFVVLASDLFLLWKWSERMQRLILAQRQAFVSSEKS